METSLVKSQCLGKTKSGIRCKHMTYYGYCYNHENQNPDKATLELIRSKRKMIVSKTTPKDEIMKHVEIADMMMKKIEEKEKTEGIFGLCPNCNTTLTSAGVEKQGSLTINRYSCGCGFSVEYYC